MLTSKNHSLDNPAALNQAYTLMSRWAMGTILFFIAAQLLLPGANGEPRPISIMAIGLSQLTLGVGLIFRTRAARIVRKNELDGALGYITWASYLIAGLMIASGSQVLFEICSTLLSTGKPA